jgi:hypothetical protein
VTTTTTDNIALLRLMIESMRRSVECAELAQPVLRKWVDITRSDDGAPDQELVALITITEEIAVRGREDVRAMEAFLARLEAN